MGSNCILLYREDGVFEMQRCSFRGWMTSLWHGHIHAAQETLVSLPRKEKWGSRLTKLACLPHCAYDAQLDYIWETKTQGAGHTCENFS